MPSCRSMQQGGGGKQMGWLTQRKSRGPSFCFFGSQYRKLLERGINGCCYLFCYLAEVIDSASEFYKAPRVALMSSIASLT